MNLGDLRADTEQLPDDYEIVVVDLSRERPNGVAPVLPARYYGTSFRGETPDDGHIVYLAVGERP